VIEEGDGMLVRLNVELGQQLNKFFIVEVHVLVLFIDLMQNDINIHFI
jgi:hypothetical protein